MEGFVATVWTGFSMARDGNCYKVLIQGEALRDLKPPQKLLIALRIKSKLLFITLASQLLPTLCDSMYHSLPGSSVHGILQARSLEWVAMPSSRGSS